MFWNNRVVRLAVGFLLLAVGIVAILPGLTGYSSLDGTVNARFTVLSAPIEGVVTNTPPKVGSPLLGGTELLGIRNERIARTAEAQLAADLNATRKRLDATKAQRQQLARLQEDLKQRLTEYQDASIQSISQEIAIRRQRITNATAHQQAAQADLSRKQTLGSSGIVATSSVEQARAASVAAGGEGTIARAELERLNRQLEAVQRGIFVGEGRNDVPYSQQRTDEVTIQLAELLARERDHEARAEQLEKQLDQERARNHSLQYALIRMPFDGVIWRNTVVDGSNVIAGNELLRVLDCRDLFVDILVSEIDYDDIYPGRDAEVRLLGRSTVVRGTVMSVRGSAAVVEEVVLAATPPQSRGKSARIRVALPRSHLNEDYPNFCQVGRTVQVRFATRSFPLKRWMRALWFSTT